MKLLCSGIYLFCLLAAANAAKAEDAAFRSDDGAIRISGRACERFTPDEAKSTIRVRVTDKASFLAVSSAAEVSTLWDEMNEHDYNVLVYNLVDNAVEDLAVRTTKQDAEELCVEAEGYIHPDSILQAMAEQTESEPDADGRETMTDIVNEVNTSYSEIKGSKPEVIPPTDETELAKHKAPESDALPPAAAAQASGSATVAALPVSEPAPQDDKRGLVYVEPTEFFDKSTSAVHAKTVRDMFADDENYFITDKKDLADYIIRTRVLKAKVDPINSSTNRLHMVVSVEAEFPDEKSSVIEHQNRFVLFNSDENEQEVAFRLMKKLFTAAGEKIKDKVNQAERRRRPDKALPDIITPGGTKRPA